MTHLRMLASGAAAASLIVSSSFVAPASATPSGPTPGVSFVPSLIVNGDFGTLHVNTPGDKTDKWGMMLKTLDETGISADRLTVQESGFSGWHAHPGPVFVTVTQGSITWFDGSDPLCVSRTFTVGESFIEDAYVVHNVVNASASADAEFIAIAIKPEDADGLAFRLDRPEPTNC